MIQQQCPVPGKVKQTTFYSQWGEDRLLAWIFRNVPGGVCVEVGAHNGIDASTTYSFEKAGWQCVLIEPNPRLHDEIMERRKARLFECAASDRNGTGILSIAESVDSWSTLSENEEAMERIKLQGSRVVTVPVALRTMDEILTEAAISAIDFISIDVEGHELAVLRGLSLERWKPRVVLLEDTSDQRNNSVQLHMKQRGYIRFYRTGENDWYAGTGDLELTQPLQLFCSGRYDTFGLLKAWLPAPMLRLMLNTKRWAEDLFRPSGRQSAPSRQQTL